MTVKILNACYRLSLATIFALLCIVAAHGQPDVKVSNTAKQKRPGVYESIIYVEVNKEVSNTIDDVIFTLPPGYSNRKQRAQKIPQGTKVRFASKPFITTEEAFVNVLIEFKGGDNRYVPYKLVLFTKK